MRKRDLTTTRRAIYESVMKSISRTLKSVLENENTDMGDITVGDGYIEIQPNGDEYKTFYITRDWYRIAGDSEYNTYSWKEANNQLRGERFQKGRRRLGYSLPTNEQLTYINKHIDEINKALEIANIHTIQVMNRGCLADVYWSSTEMDGRYAYALYLGKLFFYNKQYTTLNILPIVNDTLISIVSGDTDEYVMVDNDKTDFLVPSRRRR